MTSFSDLYPYVRAILGDSDSQKQLYSDQAIDSHIKLQIALKNSPDIQQDGTDLHFTTDLSLSQQAVMALRIAKAILAPQADTFAYRTPAISVSRKGGVFQLMRYIDEQLIVLEGGATILRYETEIHAIVNHAHRFLESWTHAYEVDTPAVLP